jgi:exodeoxyribonuclease VII small subunit
MSAAQPEKKSFKERMEDLQALVDDLESGDLGLEEAIARFEAGRKLHAELLLELQAYEKRLVTLEPAAEPPEGD